MNTFAYVVGTRGHARRADAAIEVALHLAHAPERVIPVVSIDNDDTQSMQFNWGDRVNVVSGPRPTGIGEVWNRAFDHVDAEFYIHASDDGILSSPGWDVILDAALTTVPMRELAVVCLNDLTNRGLPTHPVVSREWIRLTGKWFDDRFPFWFIDSALNEVAAFVTGGPVRIINQACVSVKNAPTVRMQNLKLWAEFFMATRKERVDKAREIRGTVGISVDQNVIDSMIASADAATARMIAKADETEKRIADTITPLPPRYYAAKRYAEDYIAMKEAA